MSTNSIREYNCRVEELPIICRFTAFSLNRDLSDFSNYAGKFDADYLEAFNERINTCTELLLGPKTETVQLKLITDNLYNTMGGLITPINHLSGYIDLADGTIPISMADFGLTALRKGISIKDTESVLNSLHMVSSNIARYNEALTAMGMKPELVTRFANDTEIIAENKQQQYEILSGRRIIVQNNTIYFNELYDILQEILKVGKILYKFVDPAKLLDYTFTELRKRVRRTTSTPDNTPTPPATVTE
jgi:hypothetical protein